MQPNLPSRKAEWRSLRWLAALAGLILLIIGQTRLASDTVPPAPPTRLAAWLTEVIHLSIPSIDNVLSGLPYLIAGAALLFLSLRRLRLVPPEAPLTGNIVISLRPLRSLWPWLAGGTGIFLVLLWQINRLDYSGLMVAEWLAAPMSFLLAAALWDHQRQIDLSPRLGRRDLLWMLGLFLLSLLVGTYHLQGLPDMLMGDEGSFWTAARDIANGQFKPPVFANGVYTFPVLSSIGQAAALKLFGLDLWGWRFGSVLSGALTVFPLYLLAREAFDRKTAIASCFALAFSPYFLAFARLGYNNIQALFITTLALHWLYRGIRRYSIFYLFLAGCAAGFGFYTYFAARMALVIALLFVGALWIFRKLNFRQATLAGLLLLLSAGLVAGPYFAYGRIHDAQGLGFKTFESVFFNTFNGRLFYSDAELSAVAPFFEINGNELFYNPQIYLVLIARGILRTLLVFQKPWLISEHFIAFPLAGTVGVIFYLIGAGATLKRLKEPRGLLLALWFLVVIFGLSILNTVPPRHTHMVNIIPLLALLIGLGANVLANACIATLPALGRWRRIVLGVLIVIFSLGGIYDYFVLMPRRYHPQPDQIISWTSLYAKDESLVYIYKDQREADLVLPYIAEEFRPEVSYQAISYQDFQSNPAKFSDDGKYLLFYPPELADSIETILSQLWGQQLIRRDFYSPDGIPVLAAGMNTPFVFERDRSIGQVLLESYLRPPLLILLGFLFLLLGTVAFLPAPWTRRLPRPIEAILRWVNAPVEAVQEGREATDLIEAETEAETGEQATGPGAPAESPEPPEWLSQVFASEERKDTASRRRFQVRIRRVRSSEGSDLYVHIHLPAFHLAQGWYITIPPVKIPGAMLLLVAMTSAILAQILVSQSNILPGVFLYALCAAAMIAWARLHPKWKGTLLHQMRLAPRAEIVVGLLLLAAIAFSRFYDLNYRVYGLEADETKWTAQAWFSVILGEDIGDFATMHYKPLPVDFWIRAGFLRLFGLNFLSGRIESAVLSLAALVFLYLLVRRLTSSPAVALVASALYAFSYVELNGSHQALHNTTLEVWMMAGLYFLVLALQEKRQWQFQIAGIVLALGMLTYETFYPTVGLGLVFLFGAAIVEVRKRRANLRQWLPRFLLVLWPILVVYLTFTQQYLRARHGYHFGWLEQAAENGGGLWGAVQFLLNNVILLVKAIFASVTLDDSLLRWNGSFVNQLLLPFVVIGLVYNLLNLRRPFSLFLPLWFLINVLPGPILLGSVWPRVLYTALAPLMIWGAMGLWVSFGAIRNWLDGPKARLAVPVFLLSLLTIFASDYFVFVNRINDPVDRVKRRELADFSAAAAANSDLVLYPYFPAQNDSLELEWHVILFSVAGGRNAGLEAQNYYQQVLFENLLLAIWQNQDAGSLSVIFDKSALALIEERRKAIEVLLRCYPGTTLVENGKFFDVYRLETDDLTAPLCYQSPAPTAISPLSEAEIRAGQTITFAWTSPIPNQSSALLQVEQKQPNSYWIEAEDVFQGNGWYSAAEFAADFTGNGFLLDNWQAGASEYTLNLEETGEYAVWIRSFKRRYNDQQNYLAINGESHPFAGDENALDTWAWERVGTFDLPAGPATLALSRTYGQDEQYSVFIDSILLTSDLQQAPGLDSIWKPIFQNEIAGPVAQFNLGEGLAPGKYRWSVRVFDGNRLIDSLGERGVSMPPVEFSVVP
jgi:4-amino-4-deoxy-L-arabinose transferase-like glycosyltransferase